MTKTTEKKMEKLEKQTPRRVPNKGSEIGTKKPLKGKALKNFRQYQKDFLAANYRQYSVRFRPDKDQEIIALLDDETKVPNLTQFLRELITEYLNAH